MTTMPLRLHAGVSDRLLPATFFIGLAGLKVAGADADSPLEWAHTIGAVAFVGLIGYLYVLRAPRRGGRASPLGAMVAVLGTFAPFALALAPTSDDPSLLALGTGITVAGLGLSILSLAKLGRFFGVFPEARGLVTSGPYHLVRHPLYVAEFVAIAGFVVAAPSGIGVAAYAAFVMLQGWRALNEERALTAVFPEYEAYRARTARFVPFVW